MGELALRKINRRLEGPRIDLDEKVAFVDKLAFLEADLHQLAIDLRLNRNGGERRNSSEACYRLIDLASASTFAPPTAWMMSGVARFSRSCACGRRNRQAAIPRGSRR